MWVSARDNQLQMEQVCQNPPLHRIWIPLNLHVCSHHVCQCSLHWKHCQDDTQQFSRINTQWFWRSNTKRVDSSTHLHRYPDSCSSLSILLRVYSTVQVWLERVFQEFLEPYRWTLHLLQCYHVHLLVNFQPIWQTSQAPDNCGVILSDGQDILLPQNHLSILSHSDDADKCHCWFEKLLHFFHDFDPYVQPADFNSRIGQP